jgi:hypothetical protein
LITELHACMHASHRVARRRPSIRCPHALQPVSGADALHSGGVRPAECGSTRARCGASGPHCSVSNARGPPTGHCPGLFLHLQRSAAAHLRAAQPRRCRPNPWGVRLGPHGPGATQPRRYLVAVSMPPPPQRHVPACSPCHPPSAAPFPNPTPSRGLGSRALSRASCWFARCPGPRPTHPRRASQRVTDTHPHGPPPLGPTHGAFP